MIAIAVDAKMKKFNVDASRSPQQTYCFDQANRVLFA